MSHQPTKMGICREELVALTRDPLIAMVLNQLLYWTQRVKDYDLYLKEERGGTPALDHGWIYKTSDDLSEESMVCVSRPTMRRYLSFLKDQGWIQERANPSKGWDRTIQYRVNLNQLQKDLHAKGYKLPSSFLPLEEFKNQQVTSMIKNETALEKKEISVSFEEIATPQKSSIERNETSMFQNEPQLFQNVPMLLHGETGIEKNETSYTYTETTTETKDKDYSQRKCAQAFYEKMIEAWKRCISFDQPHPTEERKQNLEAVLQDHFQGDFAEWERFCERVKASPFLMGGGPNKWRVSLDWILSVKSRAKVTP